MPIKNIQLSNISIKAREGMATVDGDQISFTNVKLDIEKGLPLFINNSKNVVLKDVNLVNKSAKALKVSGKRTEAIKLELFGKKITDADLEIGNEVPMKAVIK